MKLLLPVLAALIGFAATPAHAQYDRDHIADCVQDDKVPAENIVRACENGIASRVAGQGGLDEYVPQAYLTMAVAQERLGKYKDAQASLVEVLKKQLGSAVAWAKFAEDSAKLGESPALPMQMLDAFVKKTPKNEYVLRTACRIRGMLNQQLDVAVANCDDALRIAPKDEWGYYSRCLVRYRKGDLALAIGDCDEALRIDPKFDGALYIRGLANLHMGQTDLGNADIAAAKTAYPKVAEEYAMFGIRP
ncbi:MAG TPA: hypothetical protein VMF58_06955 [Rhizomicrobium sp.]|nr:hypothetical protein [Rhizomicrobium sp.]